MAHMTRAAATAVFLCSFGAAISAQLAPPVPSAVPNTVTSAAASSSVPKGQAMIHGRAIDRDSSPLPNATVRLRNLASGQIEKVSNTNQVGEFTFIVKPEFPYVVELADQAGQILAIGNVVTVQMGEVAGAVVQVPVRLPALVGLLGNMAGSVVSAATGAGITALAPTIAPPPPASPEN